MGEDWLTQALTSRWTVAVVAFFLGAVAGWLIRRAVKTTAPEAASGDNGDLDESANADVTNKSASAPLAALEDEIKRAKSILEADRQEQAVMAEILAALDEAVKRANGRLKLIAKSIKKEKNDE